MVTREASDLWLIYQQGYKGNNVGTRHLDVGTGLDCKSHWMTGSVAKLSY